MTSLYKIWQMKWETEYDRLRTVHPDINGKPSFNVTGEERLSDLRSWEWYAEKNYVPQMPMAGASLVSVLTLVSIGFLARTVGVLLTPSTPALPGLCMAHAVDAFQVHMFNALG